MKRKKNSSGAILNRRAHYDYSLGDSIVVGIALTGKEAKSLRQGNAHLRGSYVTIKDGELWLINATIASGKTFSIPETEQTRTRKLLAKRKEIEKLVGAKQQGNTIVPILFTIDGQYVKLKIAIGKGKKHYDKREVIKKREESRQMKSV